MIGIRSINECCLKTPIIYSEIVGDAAYERIQVSLKFLSVLLEINFLYSVRFAYRSVLISKAVILFLHVAADVDQSYRGLPVTFPSSSFSQNNLNLFILITSTNGVILLSL